MVKKDPTAVKLGRKGGKARMKTMTEEERIAVARKGGQAFAAKLKKEKQK
jgi:general stress protein YciG